MEAVLSEHTLSTNIANDIDERQKIPVRRKHIWSDTKRALVQSGFSDTTDLSVTFIGEPAVDDGGPLHEFFRLLMLGIKNDASLFCGSENEKSLTQCVGFAKKGILLCGEVYCSVPVIWRPRPTFLLQNHCETPV